MSLVSAHELLREYSESEGGTVDVTAESKPEVIEVVKRRKGVRLHPMRYRAAVGHAGLEISFTLIPSRYFGADAHIQIGKWVNVLMLSVDW